MMAVNMTLIMMWHYSIYRAASDRSVEFVGHLGRRGYLFVICAVSLAFHFATFPAILANPSNINAIHFVAIFVGALSYFAAIWAAANALTRFDEQRKSVETHKTLGSFVLQMYFFIGIWFIHPRLKRLLAAPLPERLIP